MAYLSRIWLNPLRRQTRRFLDEPQAMRATVLGGLPTQPVEERVLWRLDADPNGGQRYGVIVLTRTRPSWEHLVEQAGWPGSDTPETPQAEVRQYEPLLSQLAPGQSYAFRLTANPTQSTRRPEAPTHRQKKRAHDGQLPRSTRLGHRTIQHQLTWLVDRAERWGVELPAAASAAAVGEPDVRDVRIVARQRRSFRRNQGGSPVTLQLVTYEGRLVVTDANMLRDRLLNGCGPAKAYGCGLLTLAPLNGTGTTGEPS